MFQIIIFHDDTFNEKTRDKLPSQANKIQEDRL
jgi:hypothetical protein